MLKLSAVNIDKQWLTDLMPTGTNFRQRLRYKTYRRREYCSMRDLFLNNCDYSIQVRAKVWLEINGQRLFGEGRAQLFRLIQETNSINASAKAMGVSFRRAWAMVKDMEDTLNVVLVEKKRGGIGGGSTILTPTGIELLESYEKILKDYNARADS